MSAIESKIDASIFRAYDIRGVVGETLTESIVTAIGKVVGSIALAAHENQMIIARDGRHSSPTLANALAQGILSTGCDVLDIGMTASPLMYYATSVFECHSGVMVTGSHNPPNYNGLKIVMNGATLSELAIQNIYHAVVAKKFLQGNGSYDSIEIEDRYLNHLTRNIHLQRRMKIVVDAGNGVTGKLAPKLYEALGCDVHALYCDVDGNFPHHHPDPSDPKNLQALIQIVRNVNADLGIAFDGDGDRLGVVTNRGEIICPDRLLMLYAQAVLHDHPKAKIIYDVKCTNHLATLIRALNGEPIMWKTGHSLIKAKLAETHALLAGEMSGHFFFNDKWYGFDDALYAGARLLEILAKQNLDADKLFLSIPNSINTPELKVLVSEDEKFMLMQQLKDNANFSDAKEIRTIDGLRVDFADGWGLVRPSNTTPYLILRFEALNQAILMQIQNLFRDWMLSVKPDLVLPF